MIFGSKLVKLGRKFHASLTYTSAVNYHTHKKIDFTVFLNVVTWYSLISC